jgi:hypothetical protein
MMRPRLQLHLSTLLIVSVMASGLVWLNVRVATGREIHVRGEQIFELDAPSDWWGITQRRSMVAYGFPCVFMETYSDESNERKIINWRSAMLDVATCLTLLAIATVAIEWLTRRSRRKPTP